MKKMLNEIVGKIAKYADDLEYFNHSKLRTILYYATILFVLASTLSYVFGYNDEVVLFFSLSILSLLSLVTFTFQTPSEERENSLKTRKALTREFVEILKKEKQDLQKEKQEFQKEKQEFQKEKQEFRKEVQELRKTLKDEFASLGEQVKQKQEDIVGLRNEYSELQLKYASDLKKQSQRQMEGFRKNIDKKSQMLNEKIDRLLHNPIINQPSLSYTPQIQQDNIIEIEEEDEDERIFRLIEERENEGF